MFGIGMPELILILIIALIIFGPKKLPELGKALGRGIREFRQATNELKEGINIEEGVNESKKEINLEKIGDVKKGREEINGPKEKAG